MAEHRTLAAVPDVPTLRAIPPASDTTPRQGVRINQAILWVVVLVLAGWIAWAQFQTVQSRDATATQSLSLADQVAAVCAQGGQPATALGSACTKASVIQATPTAGATATPGANGTNGVNGSPGSPGANGASPACLATPSQCVGSAGPGGVDGTDGANGTNGTDGADGATGPQGSTGPAGADGKPPASFTIQFLGMTQTCTRDPGSPDGSATYSCS